MSLDSDILVVGAGPTGLTLALQASRMGAKVRVVERRSTPRAWAPALAIHPRTLETLRSLGVADEVLARGLAHVDLDIHIDETVVSESLGRLHLPETEFPFVFFAPQPEVEAVLASALGAIGVEVEWGSEFQGYEPTEGGLACRLERDGEVRTVTTGYLVGCDGSDSAVRREARIRFRGRSYRETISIADANADLQPRTAHAFLRGRGILFFFPLSSGRWRIIGPGVVNETAVEVEALVERHTGGRVGVSDVDWVKVVRPQHRLAGTYRKGRVFLAGDAAHVHSPAGAQGMNAGIQDAANLGWKVAVAARGAPDDLLDTYEAERRPVAKHVVRVTGLAFALELSEFTPLVWGRRWAAKPIASLLAPHPRLISVLARVVSGLDTRYRRGAIDRDRVWRVGFGAGRRLPDSPSPRLHHLLDGRAFTLLVFGRGSINESVWSGLGEDVVVRPAPRPARRKRGVDWVLVRPDGYIATSGTSSDQSRATRYVERWLGVREVANRRL